MNCGSSRIASRNGCDRPARTAPSRMQRDAEAVEGERLARVGRRPRPRELERLVPGLHRVAVVAPRDEEPLALADPVAQLERLARERGRQRRLPGVGVDRRQQRVRHREVGIELDARASGAESLRGAGPRGLPRARASRHAALRATASSPAAAGRRTSGPTRATRPASRAAATSALPSDVSTSSLLAASACSRAITSPVSALIASSAST